MSITHIQIVSVPVTDQESAREFYVNKLGFSPVADFPMGNDRWVQLSLHNSQTSIVLTTWFPSMGAGSLKGLVLESNDLDTDVSELRAREVTFSSEIQDEPWGRFITLADPDGNGIIIQATSHYPAPSSDRS